MQNYAACNHKKNLECIMYFQAVYKMHLKKAEITVLCQKKKDLENKNE